MEYIIIDEEGVCPISERGSHCKYFSGPDALSNIVKTDQSEVHITLVIGPKQFHEGRYPCHFKNQTQKTLHFDILNMTGETFPIMLPDGRIADIRPFVPTDKKTLS